MKPLKHIFPWLLVLAIGLAGTGLRLNAFERHQIRLQGIGFELVYPDSEPALIEATQAELMRLGFYKGLIDGICGRGTLTAQVRYLEALLNGKRFASIYQKGD